MTSPMLDVGEPTGVSQPREVVLVRRWVAELLRLLLVGRLDGCALWHPEHHVCVVGRGPFPQPVVLDEWEHLLVGGGIGVPDDGELDFTIDQPRKKLAEEAERRIRYDEISLVAQRRHLATAEIAVALKV